jgi:hypothetical protein
VISACDYLYLLGIYVSIKSPVTTRPTPIPTSNAPKILGSLDMKPIVICIQPHPIGTPAKFILVEYSSGSLLFSLEKLSSNVLEDYYKLKVSL